MRHVTRMLSDRAVLAGCGGLPLQPVTAEDLNDPGIVKRLNPAL